MKSVSSISWGIEEVDRITNGIPANDLVVLESKDHRSSIILLGRSLYEALKNGETCVLVTHQPFEYFNEHLLHFGMDLTPYLKSNRLTHLTYHADIQLIMGTSHNYDEVIKEILHFCGNVTPSRIIFHQIDALINLSNNLVMNISVSKLGHAARTELTEHTSIMSSFVCYPDSTHTAMSFALQKISSGYYTCDSNIVNKDTCLFKVIKQPWYDYSIQEEVVSFTSSGIPQLVKRA